MLAASPWGRSVILRGMRFFNTVGPVKPEKHYLIPPLDRVDTEGLLELIQQEKYFVLHAPRQTGKTSALLALRDLLHGGGAGDFRCLYASIQPAQAVHGDLERAMPLVLGALAEQARDTLGDDSVEALAQDALKSVGAGGALRRVLGRWSQNDSRPLVLLLDEVDALTGDALVSLLGQLRAGYHDRPERFPQSVVLCGLRDIRDYRLDLGGAAFADSGVSPFNIVARSVRLGDFTEAETRALLAQHTTETGQVFGADALQVVWEQTRGQPWLVNALADETCFRSESGRDRSRAIAAEDIFTARDRIVQRREVHLDQLAFRLRDPRVRRVIEPILSGGDGDEITDDDLAYVRDLGLVAVDDPIRIANPIYGEVVPRVVASRAQRAMREQTAWYVRPDGDLDMGKLLQAFQEWFRENSEHWVERFGSYEAGPQLLLHSFLHRVVNGGGWIHREQPLGAGRADLLILWPRPEGGSARRFVVECKLARRSLERTMEEGLHQTAAYMDRAAAESGHLVIFDLTDKTWDEKILRRNQETGGKPITIWGM